MKQSEIPTQLCFSSSTIQSYGNDTNMLSPYRIEPNITNKRTKNVSKTIFDNNSHREHYLKRSQKPSKDLK